ncbi:DUF4280 domain-containing protein [Clostridium gasigenes]|uniref:DUF4280 domain-containing protein n=1 Tax=Clostridium gasigenes TaxID=94869 RepID=UPI001C0B5240|nr:DUF4280 domain-containing protein [Clostridium gasigenes]MBU3104330.1 DUF4280 domain-containing protein [Clostridium gasigenes]
MAEEIIQTSYKLNPGEVQEQFVESSSSSSSESLFSNESDEEMQEKYGGELGATIVTEVENLVDGKIDTIKNNIEVAKNLVNRDEKLAEEEKAKEEAEKAAKAEEQRIENLQKQYIVNAAIIECSCSPDRSYIILPVSHGQYINDIAQLNVGDCVPNTNIMSFKVCQSPSNPKVQEAAKEVLKNAQDRKKGFFDRVMDLFGEPKEVDKIDDELLKQCAAECTCGIDGDLNWIDGEETVIVDGKPSLLGRCTTMCKFGGAIKFYTCGQEK